MIIQQADGKIENSDKRTERRKDGRGKMESMIAVAAHSQGDGNGMMRPFLPFPPPVWPVRRQIAMFVSG